MMADLLVARPFGLLLLGLGSTVYVATLPFSLMGGNAKEAGKSSSSVRRRKPLFAALAVHNRGGRKKFRNSL
ncbi:MAG: hypothetical protein CMQ20_03915 [Gammaproteobacteria bacterium]|jgi:hypothetical protein|nr:hypothetical protein [Gammaproteobacteria bacterium]